MRYDEIPHAGINTLMQWVRKQGKHVVKLQTWSQPEHWTAHVTLRGTRPLHARIKRRGYRFTVTRVTHDPTCPICSAAAPVPVELEAQGALTPEPQLVVGGY